MNRYLTYICSLALINFNHAGELTPLLLPEQLSGLVAKTLEIKTEAMKLPAMRSEEGKLGKQVENLMDQIAELADEEIAKRAQQTQEHDIRAKIILWAKDRQKRPDDYARFAKFYMNRPASREDAVEYFYRPQKNTPHPFSDSPPAPESYVPRLGTWTPHFLDKEDVIEANRHIMEYCFFMPPSGASFDRDFCRENLLRSFIDLKMLIKSYKVFEVDFNILFELTKNIEIFHLTDANKEPSNWVGIVAIIRTPNHFSYERLAHFYASPFGKKCIESSFTNYWGDRVDENDELTFNDRLEWIKLAKQDWHAIDQQNFAKRILSLPTPKKFVHPDSTKSENQE